MKLIFENWLKSELIRYRVINITEIVIHAICNTKISMHKGKENKCRVI